MQSAKSANLPGMSKDFAMWRLNSVTLLLAFAVFSASIGAQSRRPRQIDDPAQRLGVTHVAGKYCFGDQDFLNEGADRVLELGSRVIKLWFHKPAESYPYNSDWPEVNSLAEMAKTPYFRQVFAKPFRTYVLMAFSVGRWEGHFRDGMSEQEEQFEKEQFYELTKHLLTTYRGTGKTFILQHWEGDWLIRAGFDRKVDPSEEAIKGMIAWLNARQVGVNAARAEIGQDGVRVYHAAEVNRVVASMDDGRPGLINKVIPHTNVDMVSYSAWDSVTEGSSDPNLFRRALDYIAEHTPDSADFGDKNVYVGEFGIPANQYPAGKVRAVIENAVDTAFDWGCPYVIYWQLYCNELKDKTAKPPVTDNETVRGFWLIRPDGSKTRTWEYFHDLLHSAK